MQTYNLFRRQNEEDLYCAVPEDVPVPPFVTDERWEWAQSLDVSQLSGFDAKAAEISANRNGFYLFHSTNSEGGSGKAGHAGGGDADRDRARHGFRNLTRMSGHDVRLWAVVHVCDRVGRGT